MTQNLCAVDIPLELVNCMNKIRRSFACHDILVGTGVICDGAMDYSEALELYSIMQDKYGLEACNTAEQLARRRSEKLSRVRRRIKNILKDYPESVFVTLTFDDECLNNTSSDTRRRYVHYWLKCQSDAYIANIDFGEKKGREHYHAVVGGLVDPKTWTHGACNVKRIRIDDKRSSTKIAKYILKLANHALKSTTECHKPIYSRGREYDIKPLTTSETFLDDDGFISSLFDEG